MSETAMSEIVTDKFGEMCQITHFGTLVENPLLHRVRGEYRDMPGMRLTVEQAMRLWGLDRSTCTTLLNSLVAEHFLERDGTGRCTLAHSSY